MHIAIVTHNVIKGDGQGRVNHELTRHFLRQGLEVTLIADTIDESLGDEGVHWLQVPTDALDERIDLLKIWRFRRKANRLLHEHGDSFDAILACGAVLTYPHALNAVHFVHGTWLRSPFHSSKVRSGPYAWYQWLVSTLNARWEREAFERADHLIAVSDMVRDELVEIGVPPEDISVIVNGVDIKEFAPGPADRQALGLPVRPVLGLFVGDIQSPIKNLDAVLHAMVDVDALHLAVAGSTERSPYPGLAAQLGIEDRVHFLGFRRDIPDLMRAADFFALPSRRDSCPLVHLEAMASGLPTIVSNRVGTANLVGEAGFVIDAPDDIQALTRAMRRMVADPEERERMGDQARRTAETLRWERMAEQYADFLLGARSHA
jgi:glycosyltransferase involved in cell wall biosynthesis